MIQFLTENSEAIALVFGALFTASEGIPRMSKYKGVFHVLGALFGSLKKDKK